MWYFVWIIAILLSLACGLIALLWVEVRESKISATKVIEPARTVTPAQQEAQAS